MDLQKLRELIENVAISDEDVYRALKEILADKFDGDGNIIPPTEEELTELGLLGVLINRFRPQILERQCLDFLKEHGEHCPACQELKRKTENKKL